MFPTRDDDAFAWVDTDEMREVDRVMIDDLDIDLPRMMEGAGRCLAQVIERVHAPARVVVLAGPGGNGGGGLVAARHLVNHGVDVTVVLGRPPETMTPVPLRQFRILERLGVNVADDLPSDPGLIVDALIGYSLRGAPRGRTEELINATTAGSSPVVSLDCPSGLDCTSGATPGAVVQADTTVTIAAPKVGLGAPVRHGSVGRLFVADISVPPFVYTGLGKSCSHVFDDGPIIEVTREH